MNDRLRSIVRRRRLLVTLAAEQRGELAMQAGTLRRSLAFAEVAWRSYRRLKASPVVVAVAAAAVLMVGPGRLLNMAYRSGLLVQGLLRLARQLKRLH
jgi:hypothetical protein